MSTATAAQGKSCEWDRPGHDPYMGDIPSAVDHYTDIPVATRNRLKDRMRRLAYDDMATIRSDRIEGRQSYEPAIRDMHFGEGRTCGEVTRRTWPAGHAERGLVYCEDGFCVLVPFVCRNVSRIRRQPMAAPPPVAMAAAPGVPPPALPMPVAMQQLPPPPPAWPPAETFPGSAMVLSPLLLPPSGPYFPSRIYFPDEPAIAFYPPSVMPPPPLPPVPPAVTPPAPPPPPVGPPSPPSPEPPFPPLPPLPPDPPTPYLPPDVPVSPIPEPGTGVLMGAGLLVLLARAYGGARSRRETRDTRR